MPGPSLRATGRVDPRNAIGLCPGLVLQLASPEVDLKALIHVLAVLLTGSLKRLVQFFLRILGGLVG